MRVFFSFTFLSLINVLSAQEIQFLNQYTSNEIGSYATEVLELNEQLLGMLSHDVEMYRISYEMPFMGDVTCDDFFTGHCAALSGGTTLHVDFALPIDHDLEKG